VPNSLGEAIRTYRTQRELTQTELAAEVAERLGENEGKFEQGDISRLLPAKRGRSGTPLAKNQGKRDEQKSLARLTRRLLRQKPRSERSASACPAYMKYSAHHI
jgi:transcriptional regulator with XRE-family HTH domain